MRVADRLVLTLLTFGRKVEPQEATPAARNVQGVSFSLSFNFVPRSLSYKMKFICTIFPVIKPTAVYFGRVVISSSCNRSTYTKEENGKNTS